MKVYWFCSQDMIVLVRGSMFFYFFVNLIFCYYIFMIVISFYLSLHFAISEAATMIAAVMRYFVIIQVIISLFS